MARVVMVVGVAGHVGQRLADLFAAGAEFDRVIGADAEVPSRPGRSTDFVLLDPRSPISERRLRDLGVDTVVLAYTAAHVLTTMQLLHACQQARGVRKLVVMSSSAVYGSSPGDPAMFTEDMEASAPAMTGPAADAIAVESYVRGLARRRPAVVVTTLRLATVIGAQTGAELATYFALPLVPTVLGFDPRLQFLSDVDAVEALRRATLADTDGTFNVAGDGVLLLSQAISRAGRPPLPLPPRLTRSLARAGQVAGQPDIAQQLALLYAANVVDTTAVREAFGFSPSRTTRQAFDDFVHWHGLAGPLSPEPVRRVEETVLGFVTGRSRSTVDA